MAEYKYPTEVIDLPSGGLFYPENSPLRTGQVDVKYMTAKDEDILTSTNLIQKGVAIDKLMESLVVTKGVHPDDLLLGDLNAVMVAARILAYGKDYPITVGCDRCGSRFDHTVDLTTLETIPPKPGVVNGEYTLELPTGAVITFRLLTRGDEKKIRAEVEALKKLNNQVETDSSTTLKYLVTSVNGNRDPKTVREFVDSMMVRDARVLRKKAREVSPDVNFDLNLTCSVCSSEVKARMPLGATFFWPEL